MASPKTLDKERHLRYWQRCFRTYLPTQYTGHDSTRMALAFFIVAAYDLLSPPASSGEPQHLKAGDRAKIRSWVLGQQHPGGGFCGSPSHSLPAHQRARGCSSGDANVAATYFALLLLAIAGDDTEDGRSAFVGVDRVAALRWLKRLQRPDGSFGELVLDDGSIEGGRDMRLCYLASSIRWFLRGDVKEGEPGWVEDIDVPALMVHIRAGQTYDGGVAESSGHEAHAGYAYCAIGALSLLGKPLSGVGSSNREILDSGIPNREELVKFLVQRQFSYMETDEDEEEEDDEPEAAEDTQLEGPLTGLSLDETTCVGFNGRCNKVADTCYCWWVGGTLAMLSEEPGNLLAVDASRNFLFTQTQHLIGGFSKYPGGPPDIYHAYLGLAALATMGDTSLKQFDTSLCVSVDTVKKAAAARDALIATDMAREAWETMSHADASFWQGKDPVWPRYRVDDETRQKLSSAIAGLAADGV